MGEFKKGFFEFITSTDTLSKDNTHHPLRTRIN